MWDDPLVWSDLLTWRHHVYTAIMNSLQGLKDGGMRDIDANLLCLGVNETAWSVNRFARSCRKKHLLDCCITSLQKLFTFPTMDCNDFFTKTKEQVKAYLEGKAVPS